MHLFIVLFNTIIKKSFFPKIIFIAVAFSIAYYFDGYSGFLLSFFVLDGADGCAGGGAGGAGGAGGGSGGSCGSGPGCCGSDASSSSDMSTPFICTWNGKKFVFENDFLFGKPNSLFSNKEEGTRTYESGAITPDVYKIQNNVTLKSGYFVAQIKEIEPEESYIDHLSLSRVVYPKNAELIIDSKFEKIHVFEKKALERLEGVISQGVTLNGENVSSVVGNTKNTWKKMGDDDGYMLHAGEYIEIEGKVKDRNQNAYLLLRAHYRDWTAGEIFNTRQQKYIYSR
ncbi:MAG: hypothetical protein HYT27_03605 [Parcubacteria group bacterium]|nr:hypothetical protein [Parcubacteria group bacterium]